MHWYGGEQTGSALIRSHDDDEHIKKTLKTYLFQLLLHYHHRLYPPVCFFSLWWMMLIFLFFSFFTTVVTGRMNVNASISRRCISRPIGRRIVDDYAENKLDYSINT